MHCTPRSLLSVLILSFLCFEVSLKTVRAAEKPKVSLLKEAESGLLPHGTCSSLFCAQEAELFPSPYWGRYGQQRSTDSDEEGY